MVRKKHREIQWWQKGFKILKAALMRLEENILKKLKGLISKAQLTGGTILVGVVLLRVWLV